MLESAESAEIIVEHIFIFNTTNKSINIVALKIRRQPMRN